VRVLPLNKETQPLIYRPETQPLCGLNRVRFVYTQRIRKLRGFDGEMPQVGERVICCRNNRDEGLFNGGLGTLLSIGKSKITGTISVDVQMDDFDSPHSELVVDPYLFRRHFTNGEAQKLKFPKGGPRLDEFDHGVVLTVHKGQGSSWDDVTVVDDSHCFRDHQAKHLYTAVTRAERALTVLVRV
jgi:exodeoxyribonuclease-5